MEKVIKFKIKRKKPLVTIAIRVEPEVKSWYKTRRKTGYTRLMADVLKAYMESQK
jgi:hypothetical protein